MKQAPLVALVLFVIAMFAVVEPLAAAGPHAEGKKGGAGPFIYKNEHGIAIPDQGTAAPYPSAIKVKVPRAVKKPKIIDIDLRLRGFSHTYVDDVAVLLVAPNGDNAIVMSDVGGPSSASNLVIHLDDDHGSPLPDNFPLVNGTFQPAMYSNPSFPGAPAPSGASALSTFDGAKPNGTWKLYVLDEAIGDGGTIDGWELWITVKGEKSKHHKHHKHHKKH